VRQNKEAQVNTRFFGIAALALLPASYAFAGECEGEISAATGGWVFERYAQQVVTSGATNYGLDAVCSSIHLNVEHNETSINTPFGPLPVSETDYRLGFVQHWGEDLTSEVTFSKYDLSYPFADIESVEFSIMRVFGEHRSVALGIEVLRGDDTNDELYWIAFSKDWSGEHTVFDTEFGVSYSEEILDGNTNIFVVLEPGVHYGPMYLTVPITAFLSDEEKGGGAISLKLSLRV
jgi:hypothetical protein